MEHRRTARNLAMTLFEMERWAEAHDTFASAITASEFLYTLGIGVEPPAMRLREHGEMVAHDAFCLMQMRRPRDAAARLESGRARAMDEMLERDRLALEAIPYPQRVAFERAQAMAQAVLERGQHLTGAGGDLTSANLRMTQGDAPSLLQRSMEGLAHDRRRAQDALDAAATAIRTTRADFLHPPIAFRQIAGAISAGQALIYLATTVKGALALIIPGGATELGETHMLLLPTLTTARLEALAPREAEDETVVKTQLGNLPRPAALDTWLAALGQDLMSPLAERLHAIGVKGVTLIPTGRLATLPLHAAPIGAPTESATMDATVFLDDFTVTFAPSAQRLGMARAAAAVLVRSGVATVGNPQPASVALEWAEHEAEAVGPGSGAAGNVVYVAHPPQSRSRGRQEGAARARHGAPGVRGGVFPGAPVGIVSGAFRRRNAAPVGDPERRRAAARATGRRALGRAIRHVGGERAGRKHRHGGGLSGGRRGRRGGVPVARQRSGDAALGAALRGVVPGRGSTAGP